MKNIKSTTVCAVLNKNKIGLRSGVYIQKEKQLYFDFIEDSEIVFFDLPEFKND